MVLDSTKPDGSTLFSELDDYQRETREYVNELEATVSGKTFAVTNIDDYDGLDLIVGYDLKDVSYETIELSTGGSTQSLTKIEEGREGQVKQIIFRDDNIYLEQNKSSTIGGTIRLNTPEGDDTFFKTNDIIAFVNQGGDGGYTSHGYWQEMYRTLAV